jgi:predicted nuclease of predicted toxin-antitoxin system
MRIKLDENLPSGLVPRLKTLGHDVDTVHAEGLAGQPDSKVWRAVQGEKRFFITQDMDFSDIRQFEPGTHAGILLLRLHVPDRRNLIARLEELYTMENASEWEGCFVVATDRKVRVVRMTP